MANARPKDGIYTRDVLSVMREKKLTFRESCAVVAARHGVQADSVRRMVTRWQNARADVKRPSHTFPDDPDERGSIARYDGHLRIEADRAIVVGDVHVPTTDWAFAQRVVDLAKVERVKTLCIVGDLFNFDALSDYANLVPGISLQTEIAAARELIASWLETFDRVYMCLGNHEHRLMRKTNTALGWTEINAMIAQSPRFVLSPYAFMDIRSGDERWRLTHQRNYSKRKLTVANGLAMKLRMNVITHHEHHSALGLADDGDHAIVNNGGLHDAQSMAYVQLVDSTSPRMTQGFVYLDRGTAHLLTPYSALTNWSRWLTAGNDKTLQFSEVA